MLKLAVVLSLGERGFGADLDPQHRIVGLTRAK